MDNRVYIYIKAIGIHSNLKKGTVITVMEDINKGEDAFIRRDPITEQLCLVASKSKYIMEKGKFRCSCGKHGSYWYLGEICDKCGTAVKKIS